MATRRLTLGTLVWLCALVCLLALTHLALTRASAQAAVRHEYLSKITEVPASSGAAVTGPFGRLNSMSVDSGELYIADRPSTNPAEGILDKFNASSGAFVSQLPQVPSLSFLHQGVAVGHATGEAEVYVGGDEFVEGSPKGVAAVLGAGGNLQAVWKGTDTPSKAFGCFECGGTGDVAVDESGNLSDWAAGDVYVADPVLGVVDVFKPEADGGEKYVTQLTGTEPPSILFSHPVGVAVNQSNGEVVVADRQGATEGVVSLFKPAAISGQYEFAKTLAGPGGPFERVSGVTVDGGNGDIYVSEGESGIIDQFSAEGIYRGRLTGTPSGPFKGLAGVAVDPESHRVYAGEVGSTAGVVDVFGPSLVIPDVTPGPVSNREAKSVTLTGTVNPDKAGEAACQFLWGPTTALGQSIPCSTPVAEGESPVLVQASLSGLQPDTVYYYRLQATNANGTNPGESSQDLQFTTAGPGLRAEASAAVTAESATLSATIDPNAAPATYYFQYGTDTTYGMSAPAPPGSSLGSGKGNLEVSQHIQGLQADTVYHYRVVVISELPGGEDEEFAGPDQTFTTQTRGGGLALPDGRNWEMVSPPEKLGALFTAIKEGIIQASANGDAIADLTRQPTEAEPQGYSNLVSVLSTRGSSEWSSQVIAPPHIDGTNASIGEGQEYRFFSEDLSRGIVQPFGSFTPLSPEASESTAYLRTDYLNGEVSDRCERSCFQPLVTAADTPPGTQFGEATEGKCEVLYCGPEFLGGTPDLSHVLLRSSAQLTQTPVPAEGLYEWASGRLQLISVLPEGEEAEGGGTAAFAPSFGERNQAARHAISDDGSRVIWMGSNIRNGGLHLYLRETLKGETVQLDKPQGGTGTGESEPDYMMASSDGSRIFFLDAERLTTESSTSGVDLYEYDLNAPVGKRLTDLTVDRTPGEAAGVVQVDAASEDGSYVYFVATGALASGARAGGFNLYLRHAGVTTVVASLSPEDISDWSGGVESTLKDLEGLTVRTSPDGHWLAFMSSADLTGYDTQDAISGHPDEEVYLYSASSNELSCASCNPTGARPVGVESGDGTLLVGTQGTPFAANVLPWTQYALGSTLYQSRYLSDSGRLFFDSNDALVPQDVNGTQDVYEFEPPGVGDCSASAATFSERSGGCVGLISSGSSAEESAFLDASETGGDVFFLTAARLLPQDFDNALDVYDAHECRTGAPCFAAPQVIPPPCSTGDSCKPAPTPQPSIFGATASATFSGAGNVAPSAPAHAVVHKSLTEVQKLDRALRVCAKQKHRKQRVSCRQKARKRYGTGKARKGKATKKGRG
jgi:hypothetical protein